MTLHPENHEYPRRRFGMDHDRYEWSLLQSRAPILWPGNKTIALWITVAVEVFPLDDDGKPFKLPGSMNKPYPDVQTYTWRDYGNRVGIYRVMRALDKARLKPTWAVNGVIADKYPGLLRDIVSRGEEIIAHGYDMASPHHGGMEKVDESDLISRTLGLLDHDDIGAIRGWLSPGKSESPLTPELLAEVGIEYLCDWPNDELPYPFHTESGPLVAMPHSTDLDDRKIIIDQKHDEVSFVEQIKDHYEYLSREAASKGGRVLSLNLHPWVIGQSHRIAALEEVLDFLSFKEDIWSASGSEILDAWQAATGTTPEQS